MRRLPLVALTAAVATASAGGTQLTRVNVSLGDVSINKVPHRCCGVYCDRVNASDRPEAAIIDASGPNRRPVSRRSHRAMISVAECDVKLAFAGAVEAARPATRLRDDPKVSSCSCYARCRPER